MTKAYSVGIGRRKLIKSGVVAGSVIGASQLGLPFIISARGEVPIKVGLINPLTGTLSALARTESRGAHSREDHPQRDDRQWLRHRLYYSQNDQLDYKPVKLKPLTVEAFQPKERTY